MEKIGFIWLGIMGRPMATNLLKAGFDLVVHARGAEVWRKRRRRGPSPSSPRGGRSWSDAGASKGVDQVSPPSVISTDLAAVVVVDAAQRE